MMEFRKEGIERQYLAQPIDMWDGHQEKWIKKLLLFSISHKISYKSRTFIMEPRQNLVTWFQGQRIKLITSQEV